MHDDNRFIIDGYVAFGIIIEAFKGIESIVQHFNLLQNL